MKHLNLKLEQLEKRIAPGGLRAADDDHDDHGHDHDDHGHDHDDHDDH